MFAFSSRSHMYEQRGPKNSGSHSQSAVTALHEPRPEQYSSTMFVRSVKPYRASASLSSSVPRGQLFSHVAPPVPALHLHEPSVRHCPCPEHVTPLSSSLQSDSETAKQAPPPAATRVTVTKDFVKPMSEIIGESMISMVPSMPTSLLYCVGVLNDFSRSRVQLHIGFSNPAVPTTAHRPWLSCTVTFVR